MNSKQYEKLKGDTKLSVELAIAMGWEAEHINTNEHGCVEVGQWVGEGYAMFRAWHPFRDASIPYGLLEDVTVRVLRIYHHEIWWANIQCPDGSLVTSGAKTKTHAIISAYIAADPRGHLAKFLGETK